MATAGTSGLRYKDKVALVTGGAKGIGEGIVRAFVRNGAKVAFCDIDVETGKALESELNKTGPGECFLIHCDVRIEDDVKRTISETLNKYNHIDCLVNNAGWHPLEENIDDLPVAHFTSLLHHNLVSYFMFCKYALPHLRKMKGNIILISSQAAHLGQAAGVSYITTKGAVNAMMRAMAIDEAKHSVRVNSVVPGNIWTPLWESIANTYPNPEVVIKAGEESQLNGRIGTTEEAGQMCWFVAAEATFSTGQEFLFSGVAELNYACKSPFTENPNTYVYESIP